MKNFDLQTIKITNDPEFLDKQNKITPHIAEILESIYHDLEKGKKSVLDKLLKYVKKYPQVPIFKNYLTVYYIFNDEYEKAVQCNRWLLKEHPTYFYGLINLGNEYLEKKDYDSLLQLIGEDFNVHKMVPERDSFHPDEVISYYIIVASYLYATGRRDEAETISEMLYEFDPDNPKLDSLERLEMEYFLQTIVARNEEEEMFSKRVIAPETPFSMNTEPPVFHNPAFIDLLYGTGISEFEKILATLPETDPIEISEDLIACVQDSINRYGYFSTAFEMGKLAEEKIHFPLHAWVLMTDIETPKALETIFGILRQDDDFMEFWYSDITLDIFSQPILKYGKERLEECFNFMCEPNIDCYNKLTIADAIVPLVELFPEKRAEIISHSKNLLDFYLAHFEDPSIGDTSFISLFISNLIDIGAQELLPQITEIYEKGYAALSVSGSLDEVCKAMDNKERSIYPIPLFETSREHYEHLAGFFEPPKPIDDSIYQGKIRQLYPSNPKVGRNDPCPCGSGKKFKKCCINK